MLPEARQAGRPKLVQLRAISYHFIVKPVNYWSSTENNSNNAWNENFNNGNTNNNNKSNTFSVRAVRKLSNQLCRKPVAPLPVVVGFCF